MFRAGARAHRELKMTLSLTQPSRVRRARHGVASRAVAGLLGGAVVLAAILAPTAANAAPGDLPPAPTPNSGPVYGGTEVTVHAPLDQLSFKEVFSGVLNVFAKDHEGVLWSWGNNSRGQLGIGSTESSIFAATKVVLPAGVGSDFEFTDVVGAFAFTVALGNDGKTYAWGSNGCGQLGQPAIPASNNCPYGSDPAEMSVVPVEVQTPDGVSFVRISATEAHTFALGDNGKLYSWGWDNHHVLGYDTLDTNYSPIPQEVPFPVGTVIADFFAGGSHGIAVDTAGTLYTWGGNASGQLGDGENGSHSNDSTFDVDTPTVISVPGATFKSVSAGFTHSLALDAQGRIWSWGNNFAAQLGDGTSGSGLIDNGPITNVPTLIATPGVTFASVSAGYAESLAHASDGTLYQWGSIFDANDTGSMGRRTLVPTVLPAPPGVTFSDGSSTLFVGVANGSDGIAYTWGIDFSSAMSGTPYSNFVPVPLLRPYAVTDVKFDGVSGTELIPRGGGVWAVKTPAHAAGKVDVEVSWVLAEIGETELDAVPQPPLLYVQGFEYLRNGQGANASASASASARADVSAYAAAQAAAQAAGLADATLTASAAADAAADPLTGDPAARAAAEISSNASSTAATRASADVASAENASAQASAQGSADASGSSYSAARSSAAANSNASAAASAASNGAASGQASASASADTNANASASASASARADGDNNPAAQAAAISAAWANAQSTASAQASAAATANAEAAAEAAAKAAARASASTNASADSDHDGSTVAEAQAAAQASANSHSLSASNASGSAQGTASGRADSAANVAADPSASSTASASAAATADTDASADGAAQALSQASTDSRAQANASASAAASANATVNGNPAAVAAAKAAAYADATSAASAAATANANIAAQAAAFATASRDASTTATTTANSAALAAARAAGLADDSSDNDADAVASAAAESDSSMAANAAARGAMFEPEDHNIDGDPNGADEDGDDGSEASATASGHVNAQANASASASASARATANGDIAAQAAARAAAFANRDNEASAARDASANAAAENAATADASVKASAVADADVNASAVAAAQAAGLADASADFAIDAAATATAEGNTRAAASAAANGAILAFGNASTNASANAAAKDDSGAGGTGGAGGAAIDGMLTQQALADGAMANISVGGAANGSNSKGAWGTLEVTGADESNNWVPFAVAAVFILAGAVVLLLGARRFGAVPTQGAAENTSGGGEND